MALFGFSKRKAAAPAVALEDIPVWCGWTPRLLKIAQGLNRIIVEIDDASLATKFDWEDADQSEKEIENAWDAYNKMPVIFDGQPSNKPRYAFVSTETTITGPCSLTRISCEITVQRSDNDDARITPYLRMDGRDKGRDIPAEGCPMFTLALQDGTGGITTAIRQAAISSRLGGNRAAIVVILEKPLEAVANEKGSYSGCKAPVARIWVHERWIAPPRPRED